MFKTLAEGAFLAKRVPEFVLFEPFAYIAGGTRAENFGEALVGDVPEGYLPAVIETTGDHPAVVQYGGMRFEGMARAFFLWSAGPGPFKAGVLVDVQPLGNGEALVPAAEISGSDLRAERFVYA